MSLTRAQKEHIVQETAAMLKGAHMVVFADFKGMNVAKSQAFRRKVRKEGGGFQVVKKTLARIALQNAKLPTDALTGYKDTLAVAAHATADSALAKLFTQSAKEMPELKMIGGILDGYAMTRVEVLALAALPSRDELLAKLVGTLAAPLASFVRVLAAPLTGFVQIINSLATK